jgi:hypothetical protein
MAVRKKVSKKAPKKAVKKKLPVKQYKLECEGNAGGPCVMRALMSETLLESLSSTVWRHRNDTEKTVEFVVQEMLIVPNPRTASHFTFGVKIGVLGNAMDSGDEMPLHKFFQQFVPEREINAADYQA